jgi:hypothetical protein
MGKRKRVESNRAAVRIGWRPCRPVLTRKIVKFFTMFSDQRERIESNRAAVRIGWRPCRPVLTRKIVKFFTMFSDQRERIESNRAAARIGWRPCRPGDPTNEYGSGVILGDFPCGLHVGITVLAAIGTTNLTRSPAMKDRCATVWRWSFG